MLQAQRLQRRCTNTASTRRYFTQRRSTQSRHHNSSQNTTTTNYSNSSHQNNRQSRFWSFGAAFAVPLVALPTTLALLQGTEESHGGTTPTEATEATGTEQEQTKESTDDEDEEKGWVALYLDEKSQQQLQEHFKQYTHDNVLAKHLTLQYNPKEDEYAVIADTVGMENIRIEPIAVVSSGVVQVLYCDVVGQSSMSLRTAETEATADSDAAAGDADAAGAAGAADAADAAGDAAANKEWRAGSETIRFDARLTSTDVHPHIVLSVAAAPTATSTERVDAHELLAQVAAASLLDLARNSDEFSWSGMLPAIEGGGPSIQVSVQRVGGLTLNATACTNFRWDEPTAACKPAGECGFCKFMRAGPCGDVFTAWEDCIDVCKKEDTDFVDICGAKTMALKDCVDANPEYYGVLGSDGGAEESTAEESPQE